MLTSPKFSNNLTGVSLNNLPWVKVESLQGRMDHDGDLDGWKTIT